MAAPGREFIPAQEERPVTAKYLGGERVVTKARPRCVRRGVVPAEVATAVAHASPVLIASAGVMMASTVDSSACTGLIAEPPGRNHRPYGYRSGYREVGPCFSVRRM